MDNSENNFETRQDCITTCIGKPEQYKVIFRENFNILFQEKDPQMTLETPCQMWPVLPPPPAPTWPPWWWRSSCRSPSWRCWCSPPTLGGSTTHYGGTPRTLTECSEIADLTPFYQARNRLQVETKISTLFCQLRTVTSWVELSSTTILYTAMISGTT